MYLCVLMSSQSQWRSGQYYWQILNSSLSEADSYICQVNCPMGYTAWVNQPSVEDEQTVCGAGPKILSPRDAFGWEFRRNVASTEAIQSLALVSMALKDVEKWTAHR